MGILKKLFGGADGIREAMHDSYTRHIRQVLQGRVPATDDPPHSIGLYGALGSRYRARGRQVPEVVIWAELEPFLLMKEQEGVEALSEHVVYKEMPRHARVEWLADAINASLQSCRDDERMVMAAFGINNGVGWCSLLRSKTVETIEAAVKRVSGR